MAMSGDSAVASVFNLADFVNEIVVAVQDDAAERKWNGTCDTSSPESDGCSSSGASDGGHEGPRGLIEEHG